VKSPNGLDGRHDGRVTDTLTPSSDRFVSLDGAFNLRDLGGYRTATGATVRWRRLFRADGPERLTDRDRAVVAGLGIATVVDLRTSEESSVGDWPSIGTVHRHSVFDLMPDIEGLPPLQDAADMGRRYLFRLEAGAARFVDAIETIADGIDQPALFHCAAGKDRTGILAALILDLLGVDEETIVSDYALSHAPMQRRIATAKADPRPDDHDYDAFPTLAKSAHAETMRALLDACAERYGSISAIVIDRGLTAETTDRLRDALLA